MRKLLRFLGGVILALLALELVFRLLPVSTATRTGYHIHPYIISYPPNHRFTTATGWDLKNAQRHKANNYGFLADRDFSYAPEALGLVGDSFVEANMLPARDRLASQLESMLGGRPVYALGGPGSSLLDYAERIRFAHETFGISEFVVVLERGDIRQALCDSGHNHGPCLDPKSLELRIELQADADWTKRLFRESALAQFLFSQLKLNLGASIRKIRGLQTESRPPVGKVHGEEAIASAISETFFRRVDGKTPIKIIFLLDVDRTRLFDEAVQHESGLEVFQDYARRKEMRIVSPLIAFREYRKNSGLILEVGPYDAHWNRDAIKMVAALLSAESLQLPHKALFSPTKQQ